MTDCYTAALRILNYRFNSEAELRRKLRRKDFPADVVDETIERLRTEAWLDDERFAGAFTRAQSSRQVGRNRIARGLEAAGVAKDAIASALAQNVDAEAERARAVKLCEKKISVIARRKGDEYAASDAARQKLAAFLLGRGYEMPLVLEVVREAIRKLRG